MYAQCCLSRFASRADKKFFQRRKKFDCGMAVVLVSSGLVVELVPKTKGKNIECMKVLQNFHRVCLKVECVIVLVMFFADF